MEPHTVFYNNQPTTLQIHTGPDTISDSVRKWSCFYEHWFLDYIYKNHKDQNVIVDVGANIGNHSLFFATHLNYKHIHSFEPFPKNIHCATENLSAFKERVTLHPYALSNKTGIVQLYNSEEHNHGGYSLEQLSDGRSFPVLDTIPTRTLDSYNFVNVTLMKIDVEGHEAAVLQGAQETLKRCKPLVILENNYYYHPHVHPDPEPHAHLLEPLGFKKIAANVVESSMDVWAPTESSQALQP
jgi:FkbM family methyltransferase